MSNNTEDSRKNRLDLLKSNYSDLNNAVEESHRIAWIMTSIFVPIIFVAIAYLLKEGQNYDTRLVALAAVGIVFLLLFWIFLLRVLRIYNRKRIKQLRDIEDFITINYIKTQDQKSYLEFSLHNVYRNKPKAYFYKGAKVFAILLGLILLIYVLLHPSIKVH